MEHANAKGERAGDGGGAERAPVFLASRAIGDGRSGDGS